MLLQYFETLKKSMDRAKWDAQLLPELIEDLRFFFQTLRVKLESGDPKMRQSAADEIKELKTLLEQHPVLNLSE